MSEGPDLNAPDLNAPDLSAPDLSAPDPAAGIARHGRLRRSNPVTGALRLLALVVAVILVSGVAVTGLALWQLSSEVAANSVDIAGTGEPDADADADAAAPPAVDSYPDGFNILIVGVDNDAAQGAAYGERATALNDVNLLVHVSADHSNAVVVSIPRDLIVPHPQCTNPDTGELFGAVSAAPVNEAMGRGGLPCVVHTVADLTGLEIPYAALVSFRGVVQMSDAVGGVPVCLSDPVDDPDSGLNLPAGTSVISGETALAFLRSRHGVGDGSDLSRITSQQIYLASLMRTARGDGTFTDIPRLFSLANAAAHSSQLSTSLASPQTMVSMALALRDIDLDRLVFVQYPGSTEDPDFPGKVVPNEELADAMFGKIAADEPFSLPEPSSGEPSPGEPPPGEPEPAVEPAATPPPSTPTTDPSPTASAPASTPTPAQPTPAPPPPVQPTGPGDATDRALPDPLLAGPRLPDPESTAPTPTPTPTSTPTATPTPAETPAPAPLNGLTGRTAEDRSCAQASTG